MNELIASLMLVASGMMGLPNPASPPIVKEVSHEEIVAKACGEPEECKDIHFYTDPLQDNVILVTAGVDYSLTVAKAELIYEIGRYVLADTGKYSFDNSCERNSVIENALVQMRFDFIRKEVDNGAYKGYGLPEPKDLPVHIFYCTPSDKKAKKDYAI